MSHRTAAAIASIAILGLLGVLALLQPAAAPPPTSAPQDRGPLPKPIATQPVRGRVVNGAGRPIVGATVRCDTTALQTDVSGAFSCPLWDDGRHSLMAYAAGYADLRDTGRAVILVDLDPNPQTGQTASRGPWVLTLRHPATVSGHVVRAAQPAVNARISVSYRVARGLQRDLPPFQLRLQATTDARGWFSLTGLPPGRLVVRATMPDGAVGQSATVDVSDGDARKNLLIRLHAAAAVSVQVRSASGGSLRARVALRSTNGGAPLEATCDVRGRARFDGVPPGTWHLSASAPGHHPSPATARLLTLQPHDATSEQLILLPLSGVVGVVQDGAGKPVTSAAVVVSCARGRNVVRTTGDGVFRWAAPNRPCDVVAVHPEYASSADGRAVPGQPATLRLGLGGTVRGRVEDAEGAGVAGALVRIEARRVKGEDPLGPPALQPAHCQPDGSFKIGPLRPGHYTLRGSAPQHPPGAAQVVEVHAARTTSDVRLRLDAGAVVSGVVRDPQGKGVSGALVQLRSTGRGAVGAGDWRGNARSDADGSYRLDAAPGGTYLLVATSVGVLPARVPDLQLPEHGTIERELNLRAVAEGVAQQVPAIGATLTESPTGVVITRLTPGGPAEKAGVVVGEQVISVDFLAAFDLGIDGVATAFSGSSVQVTAEVRGANGHARTVYIEPTQ